jgi:branched-chain amino acid transport system permease protein
VERAPPLLREALPPLLLLGLLALAPFLGFGQGYAMTLLARAMILAMAAVSLSVLVGGAGLVSLGHAAPLGVGAYTVVAPPPRRCSRSSPARSPSAPAASTSS